MAKQLEDVLHYFLDDAGAEPGSRVEPGALARWLGRLDDPLEIVLEGRPLEGRRLDALARDRRGRPVLVLRVAPGADREALTHGLAERAWVAERLARRELAWAEGGIDLAPTLLLLGSRFHAETLDAVRSLGPGFVRLVVAHRPEGPAH